MPQMSPMYWTILLIFIMMIMYIYISMLYFNMMSIKPFTKKYIYIKPKTFKFKWY